MRSPSRRSRCPRCVALSFDQSPVSKARRAALTARSTSLASHFGMFAQTLPVNGSKDSKVSFDKASVHSPSIKQRKSLISWLLAISITPYVLTMPATALLEGVSQCLAEFDDLAHGGPIR